MTSTSTTAPEKKSSKVVYAAIAANAGIAVSKFIVATLTGSASMTAEGIHSTVDAGNELLLLLGMRHSAKPADQAHPFGYGKALYFWALIVALSIFTLGGGISIYHGILSLSTPQESPSWFWNYFVLAIAAAFEFYSWNVSRKALNQHRKAGESLWETVRSSKDPSVFTVFIEDSAALTGIAIAAAGIGLGQALDNPYIDPAASILIGLILIAAAIILARETGELLVGESMEAEQIAQVRAILDDEKDVEQVGHLLSMQMGPERVFLVAAVKFRRDMRIDEVDVAIHRLEHAIQARLPMVKRVFFDANFPEG